MRATLPRASDATHLRRPSRSWRSSPSRYVTVAVFVLVIVQGAGGTAGVKTRGRHASAGLRVALIAVAAPSCASSSSWWWWWSSESKRKRESGRGVVKGRRARGMERGQRESQTETRPASCPVRRREIAAQPPPVRLPDADAGPEPVAPWACPIRQIMIPLSPAR